ncbi:MULTISPECIES: flagellar basal body rod protein FlgB [unclassified Methylobacterium]|uniref:flagellar basal body rod protein FlgB n=1 Tax=unclassified Methylobacterium TaxID=2615210 RepID=UPI0006F7B207|nr:MULTISPECIES: flagellar basal body rod protein FlgB [unclassified Methylobacterium]KQP85515.1 flagellar biosynthesis protein FlgB [Methylobacterium sp. Leaf113]MCK2055748.1 flagellar basal body rod protein FlgB [Methylobacterium sp. 37f]
MSITDLPVLGMLRTRMQWHQSRQKLLAENVANVDLPGFKPRDLADPNLGRTGPVLAQPSGSTTSNSLAITNVAHIAPGGGPDGPGADPRRVKEFEIRPNGNGVNLEDEMMKAGDNQADYQMAASLYQKSIDTLKIAIGKR